MKNKPAVQTKPTHTPGPWAVETNDTTRCGLLIVDSKNVYVARMEGDYGVSVHESLTRAEANARLIAAAPDLLEAARFGKAQIIWALQECGFTLKQAQESPAASKLRAAIAKAEGR